MTLPPTPSDVVMPLSLPGSYVNLFRSRGWVGVRGGVTEMGVRPARSGEQVSTGGAGQARERPGGAEGAAGAWHAVGV